jgi:MFS family permease
MKRNVILLSLSQGLLITGSSLVLASSPLVGKALSGYKSLATLPFALLFLAQMTTTVPASMFMGKVGRRLGFMTGAMFGLAGAAVTTGGVFSGSFAIFCIGTTLIGVFNGFGQYYRFAAADVASQEFRSRAISYVLAGGVIAAFAGPNLANWSRRLLPEDFAGSYASLILIYLLSFTMAVLLKIPPTAAASHTETGRPLSVIARQRAYLVAVASAIDPVALTWYVRTVFFHRTFDSTLRRGQYHDDRHCASGIVRRGECCRYHRHAFLGVAVFTGPGLEFSIHWCNHVAHRDLFLQRKSKGPGPE